MNANNDEGKLISGKEALIALANGEEVQIESNKQWVSVENCQVYQFLYKNCDYKFRLAPRTININGIEVPAPFKPKDGEECCYISDESIDGFHTVSYNAERYSGMSFGLYRPSEVKQVVAALRQVFGGAV